MEIRRRLMMMAGGNNVITGTFTVESTAALQISYGKTFQRYILLIEMTDDSIADFEEAGISSNKAYTFLTMFGVKDVGGITAGNSTLTTRYNGSTISFSYASPFDTMASDKFVIYPSNLATGGANTIYVGYTYKYTVIPIN